MWWRGSRGGVYRVIAQKGGPVLGSVCGVDRTLRGELDRDESVGGCSERGLGTILQVLGLASGVEGGAYGRFPFHLPSDISGRLPHGHAHGHECHWVSLTEGWRSAAADLEHEQIQLCCAWAVPSGGL